jgi:hypothetical protein
MINFFPFKPLLIKIFQIFILFFKGAFVRSKFSSNSLHTLPVQMFQTQIDSLKYRQSEIPVSRQTHWMGP